MAEQLVLGFKLLLREVCSQGVKSVAMTIFLSFKEFWS